MVTLRTPDPRVTVENGDLALVQTDVHVIPSTTAGGYGRPWTEIVGRLLPSAPSGRIPLGGVEVHSVRRGKAPYVALAATVDEGRGSTEETVHQIGAELGRLARDPDLPGFADIATPALGTGVGRLDAELSFRALVDGFLSTAPDHARLRVVEVDRAKYARLAALWDSMARAVPEPEPPLDLSSAVSSDGPFESSSAAGDLPAELSSAAGSEVPPPEPVATRLYATSAADIVPQPGDGRVRDADRLGITGDVEMLASVILARDTSLPLAIGLFGDWGSGKSFFMAQLEERLDELAALATEGDPAAAPFCGQIRQIQFNAWHYIDANLWASLASTIFDGLAGSAADGDRVLEAQRNLGTAAQSVERARRERLAAERKLRETQTAANSAAAVVLSSAPALALELTRRSASAAAGEPAAVDGLATVATLGGRLSVLWTLLRTEATGRLRATALGIVCLLVAVGFLYASTLPAVAKVIASVAGLALVVLPVVTSATTWFRVLAEARHKREEPVLAARVDLDRAIEAEQRATASIDERTAELDRLRDRGRRLESLVKSAGVDYRAELGLMSRLRKDFEQLTQLVGAQPEALAAGTAPTPLREAAKGLISATDDIERIVLYIDDLDRCSHDQVVKVLQAVHLLLAFRLFVVVVGVDSRWLEASLKAHYATLLEEPADYLEKIIQVPFILRRMSDVGFEDLIGELTRAASTGSADELTSLGTPVTGEGPAEAPPEDDVSAVDPQELELDGISPSLAAAGPLRVLPRPEALSISDAERLLLERLGTIVPTPRAAKRLVNIYRMLRVSADDGDAEAFSPDGGRAFEVVVVLLGILIGCPVEASSVFAAIAARTAPATIWDVLSVERDGESEGQGEGAGDPAVGPVARAAAVMQPLHSHVTVVDIETYQYWLPRVARFSYRLARAATTGRPPSSLSG